ncbi:helix-turn-helix transcriptional regulator [Salinisphaera sp. Q1T1-3]|uniref:ArsR/SmtB family transcription factor n=1 Tax=Salinisphaera sp. Q1T1-3 TaxID=2321229 RepID=UPI000E70AE45|nr:metalloregulator ArsR/SmtB family transcription factor [Salinisphaera sp. Q1T1-3]RJS93609.1 ArsR family transcriptional regulator [Salinisphaera sp. Q1T1-3]
MIVEQLKALASDSRLQIMAWLREPVAHFPAQAHGDPVGIGVCVSHIQSKAGMSPSTASTHLAILQRARLVQATRIGKWTYYRRNEAEIGKMLDDMGGMI